MWLTPVYPPHANACRRRNLGGVNPPQACRSYMEELQGGAGHDTACETTGRERSTAAAAIAASAAGAVWSSIECV